MSEGEEEAEHPLNELENAGNSDQNGNKFQLFHPEEGIEFVEVNFQEGPLGVTLRRRTDGIVYVHDLVQGSQAMDIDVKMNDKIAVVGSRVIDGISLDKGQWDDLIDMIKKSSRPLRVVLRREMDEEIEITSQNTAHIDDTQSSESPHHVRHFSDNGPEEDEMDGKPDGQGDVEDDGVHDVDVKKLEISTDDAAPAPLPEEDPVVLQELEIMRNIQILEELSEKMFFNEKEKATTSILSFVHRKVTDSPQKRVPIDFLVKRGRKLLISSEVSVIIKGVPTERLFFLFNDLLVTAIVVGDMFQVEHAIDLQVCKVHFGLSKDKDDTIHLPPELSSPREAAKRCFEIQWPRGTLQALCASPAEREDWVQCILSAIWGCVDASGHVLGWRHQYVSGTMHAAVITRDEMRVREMLTAYQSDQLSSANIDEVDDDGYTALHYACILRLHSIIRSLHHAGAEVTIADKRGFTPLHWAALQLDIISLIILCTNMFNPDIEDHQGRTPLFLVCVEGRDVGGKSDPELLKRCITTLLGIHSDPNVRDRSNVALLHYMAASWQMDATKLLIEASADVMARGGTEGRTALHYAAAASPVKRATGEGTRIMAAASVHEVSSSSSSSSSSSGSSSGLAEVLRPENGAPTLKLLLGVGSRPNWRDVSGRSPLHLIALNEQMWGRELPEAVAALVECGARLDDSALCQLLRSKCAGVPAGSGAVKGGAQGQGSLLDAALDAWNSKGVLDGDALGLSLNGLECSEESKICYPRDGKEKCILCSALFTMFRRRHHCRLCGILCCDDCSRKKVTISAAQQRVCDGCFNYVYQRAHIATEALANDPLARLQARHSASKSELFGSAGTKGTVGQNKSPEGGGVDAAINSLSEAHDRLMERGEKLSKLSDKTAAMASASQDFEKMARQLKEQQKSSWF